LTTSRDANAETDTALNKHETANTAPWLTGTPQMANILRADSTSAIAENKQGITTDSQLIGKDLLV